MSGSISSSPACFNSSNVACVAAIFRMLRDGRVRHTPVMHMRGIAVMTAVGLLALPALAGAASQLTATNVRIGDHPRVRSRRRRLQRERAGAREVEARRASRPRMAAVRITHPGVDDADQRRTRPTACASRCSRERRCCTSRRTSRGTGSSTSPTPSSRGIGSRSISGRARRRSSATQTCTAAAHAPQRSRRRRASSASRDRARHLREPVPGRRPRRERQGARPKARRSRPGFVEREGAATRRAQPPGGDARGRRVLGEGRRARVPRPGARDASG